MPAKKIRKTKVSAEKNDQESWTSHSVAQYRAALESSFHFGTKTVNSQVYATGIRLSSHWGLDLPYVSVRTLLQHQVYLALDYATQNSKLTPIIKQINAAVQGRAPGMGAHADEIQLIRKTVNEATAADHATGLDKLDCRLRQLLVPKDNADGSYVSITPITSSGLCDYLLNPSYGLVPTHNSRQKNDRTTESSEQVCINQARFDLGGANAQNVGALCKNVMTLPVFQLSPGSSRTVKVALRLFHRGLDLSIRAGTDLWIAAMKYRSFLLRADDETRSRSDFARRQREIELIGEICDAVLQMGAEARSLLEVHTDILPSELEAGTGPASSRELLSRRVPGANRGLVDVRLRDIDYSSDSNGRKMNWPREAGELIAVALLSLELIHDGQAVLAFPLDLAGQRSLISLCEEVLR